MDNRKIKILFISSWYPNKIKPLNGIFIKRHAAALAIDCEVSAIYIRSDENYSIEESVEDGIYTIRGYYNLPTLKIPVYSNLIKFIRYLRLWRKVLFIYKKKKGKPDIINSNIVYPVSIIASCIKITWGIPYVITEHWSGYFPEDGRYKGAIKKIISKIAVTNADAVITPSYKLSRTMQALGLLPNGSSIQPKYFVIPNVVDTNQFTVKPQRDKPKITSNKFNFIHVSSLSEEKNAVGIIRVFNKFYLKHPHSKLIIVWDEEEKEFLDKLNVEPFSEDKGVFIMGKKVGTELAKSIGDADAFILFSNFENLPVVMLESFCCGVPVIGTRVGDVPEYINEKNGLLIDPGNENQLLEAMEKLFINRENYNAGEIRDMVINKVSPHAISKEFSGIYKMILDARPSSNNHNLTSNI